MVAGVLDKIISTITISTIVGLWIVGWSFTAVSTYWLLQALLVI